MRPFLMLRLIINDLILKSRESFNIDKSIESAIGWLCAAQDAQSNGGVSLRYSLRTRWDPSYPETTGYIIPTFIDYFNISKNGDFLVRAIKMAKWELSIQNSDGSFNGGPLGSGFGGFVFDTGQIIFGLMAAHRATGDEAFINAAIKAGNWIKKVQDDDGKWSQYTFHNIPHTYYTRVAWAIAELGKYTNDKSFLTAAARNIQWALTKQLSNGWFDHTGFTSEGHKTPFTHTIAYTIRGVLETGICMNNDEFINAAKLSSDSLLELIKPSGFLSGVFNRDWRSNVGYSCLTGNAQLAIIFFKLHEITKEAKYFDAGQLINRFLCKHQFQNGPEEIKGAVAGSYPIWGRYQRFAFPNWAVKFFFDSLLMEKVSKSFKN